MAKCLPSCGQICGFPGGKGPAGGYGLQPLIKAALQDGKRRSTLQEPETREAKWKDDRDSSQQWIEGGDESRRVPNLLMRLNPYYKTFFPRTDLKQLHLLAIIS